MVLQRPNGMVQVYIKSKSDPNAFIFSLTNKDDNPLKIEIDPDDHEYAIYCYTDYGQTFGDAINIINNPNTTTSSYSNLNNTYSHSEYEFDRNEAKVFLSGSHHFQLDEIEVFQKE